MASIASEPNGRRRILFTAGDGTRKTIRLGAVPMKEAERFLAKVEALIAVQINPGSVPSDEVSHWLADLGDKMHARLAAVGLVKARTGERATLGAFIDGYIESRPDVKPHTLLNMKQVQSWLVKHFGEGRDIRTITAGDAEEWVAFMRKGGLGDNTIRRHIGRARQLFKAAIRRGLVRGANPFEGMAATVRADKARMFYVTREMTAKVLDACPDAQWRLLFALSRYGGLRCPSEHLSLRWGDVDWDKNRIRVPSPKTEHHEGKDCRIIPLFPELKPYLLDVFAESNFTAGPNDPVITRYRDRACNLRTQLERIIKKAGLAVWPKPWQNCRSTRQTELAERFPIHVVCAWIGNSRAVAQEHYLQVTDGHFAQAIAEQQTREPDKAAQNPAQYTAKAGVTEGEGDSENREITVENAVLPSVVSGHYPRQDSNL